MSDIYQQINFKLDMRNTHAKCKPQTKGTVLSVCKPKGRFFRSVRLYLTDIMIDICYNWRKFWQKKWRKGAYAFGGIGQIGLIRPIGHQLVDSPTCKLVDPLTC